MYIRRKEMTTHASVRNGVNRKYTFWSNRPTFVDDKEDQRYFLQQENYEKAGTEKIVVNESKKQAELEVGKQDDYETKLLSIPRVGPATAQDILRQAPNLEVLLEKLKSNSLGLRDDVVENLKDRFLIESSDEEQPDNIVGEESTESEN